MMRVTHTIVLSTAKTWRLAASVTKNSASGRFRHLPSRRFHDAEVTFSEIFSGR